MLYNNIKPCLKEINESFFINLSSRKDRLFNIQNNTKFKISRFEATTNFKFRDGPLLKSTEKACLNSHHSLWKSIAQNHLNGNFLILEDDVKFINNFTEKWNTSISDFIPNDFNIIYLGGCLKENLPYYPKVLQRYNKYFNNIRKNNFFQSDNCFWHMTSCAYILNIKSIKILINKINEYKEMPVDHLILNIFNQINPQKVYHLNPLVCFNIDSKSDIN